MSLSLDLWGCSALLNPTYEVWKLWGSLLFHLGRCALSS